MPRKIDLPSLSWETRLGYPDRLVAGVDEVGRGCLAGPVVAGAVILPHSVEYELLPWVYQIHDSKLVTSAIRDRLEPLISQWVLAFAIGVATVEEIDRINIHAASHLAMTRALEALQHQPTQVLVDGKFLPKHPRYGFTAVIKGDQKCLSVAAASILAKVWRDRHMAELDTKYPGYGFGVHKGYSTPVHQQSLKKLGVCPIHRRSFAPVAARIESTLSLFRDTEFGLD